MAIKQPADKSYFILPDLGEGVHEAELIKWRVEPGETVEEHQILAEMETDKALVEVPSPWPGTVSELHGAEGEVLIVGNKLVSYSVKGATPSSRTEAEPVAAAAGEREDAGTVVGSVDSNLSIPSAFTRRPESTNGHGSSGRALATPAVRRIAREAGIDINQIPGSGRGGRVTASDVHAFAHGGSAPAASRPVSAAALNAPIAAPVANVSPDGVAQRIPFRGVRRKIAQALDHSVKTAVHFTVTNEADVTALDRKRTEYAAVLGQKLSFLPFIMAGVCKALRLHPTLNANVDDPREEILIKSTINLGCAVDTDHGLMVPVVNDADQLSLVGLSEAVQGVAQACRNRTIDREKLQGGTFTISNVGSYGGLFATPIINYPEVAIVAAGRVYEKVLTRDGMFYVGKALPLSLSCDHRVVDGAEGARFLNTLVKILERPETLIAG